MIGVLLIAGIYLLGAVAIVALVAGAAGGPTPQPPGRPAPRSHIRLVEDPPRPYDWQSESARKDQP